MGTTAFPLPIDLGPTRTAAEAAKAAAEALNGRIPAAPANEAGLVATVDTRVTGPTALEATLQVVKGYLDTEIAAILAAVDTEVAAIKAKTDGIPANPGTSIKSIQRGTVITTGGAINGSATISAVVMAKAELRHLGSNPGTARIALTSTTLVNSNGTSDHTISFEVTEWN